MQLTGQKFLSESEPEQAEVREMADMRCPVAGLSGSGALGLSGAGVRAGRRPSRSPTEPEQRGAFLPENR